MTRPPLIDWLTQLADEEQLALYPLPAHAAAGQDEHLRRHYALLLAAALTTQPQVGDPQSRLLRLLLASLGLADIRAALFEEARSLDADRLAEAGRLVREAKLAEHLLTDLMVLLRLDAPLADEAVRLLGELAGFLDVDQATLHRRAKDAAEILGLAAEDDDEDTPLPSPLAELWPSAIPQPLTKAALRAGLKGGLWLLESDLKLNFAWQAQGATLVFRNGAQINTTAEKGMVQLTGCRLHDARLVFTGGAAVCLERVRWQGRYDPAAKISALKTDGNPLTVRDCQFHTPGARAILCREASLTVTASRFEQCGFPNAYGGAIWHSEHRREITGCRFEGCVANKGGAVYVEKLTGIHDCEFIACRSLEYGEDAGGDIAVFADENEANPVITGCVFRQCSLYVGDSYAVHGRTIARNCQFIDGNLYYYRHYGYTFAANCHFQNGQVIERQFS